MSKKLFAIAFFAFFFGLQHMNAQPSSSGTKPEKPTPAEKVKATLESNGLSVEKPSEGKGVRVCKEITKEVKVCVEKTTLEPKSGWGADVEFKIEW